MGGLVGVGSPERDFAAVKVVDVDVAGLEDRGDGGIV